LGFLGQRATVLASYPHGGGESNPIWSCTGWGLPSRSVTGTLVRSYRTFSPLPSRKLTPAEVGGVLSVALSVPYGPRRYLASCPVVFGLSSAVPSHARVRSGYLTLRKAHALLCYNGYAQIYALQKAAGSSLDFGVSERVSKPLFHILPDLQKCLLRINSAHKGRLLCTIDFTYVIAPHGHRGRGKRIAVFQQIS